MRLVGWVPAVTFTAAPIASRSAPTEGGQESLLYELYSKLGSTGRRGTLILEKKKTDLYSDVIARN